MSFDKERNHVLYLNEEDSSILKQKKFSRIKNCLPELLAPAGSFVHMKAAIAAGADAVYLGGRRFGARAYADNFSSDELVRAIRYAHLYGRKIYMTVNVLMKNREAEEELCRWMEPFYLEGLDGVIVQDPGACVLLRETFPDLALHASTQMTITDVSGARAAKRMGMTRVVAARELSLQEILQIRAEGIEVEVFVHGALCVSYSGQCLMSSFFGGRSGNRGRCAQPCRLPYRILTGRDRDGAGEGENVELLTGHCLSPRDLCALPLLPDLAAAGVDSLKIEGRMKNPEYVAGVTSIYRKYLDKLKESGPNFSEDPDCRRDRRRPTRTGEGRDTDFSVDPDDLDNLRELYTREDFTDGYFCRHNGREMMAADFPKNTGRRIGTVARVKDRKVYVDTEEFLSPKDLLMIPLSGDTPWNDRGISGRDRLKGRKEKAGRSAREITLTVPDRLKTVREGQVLLYLPAGKELSLIKAGLPVFRRYHMPLVQSLRNAYVDRERKIPAKAEIHIDIGRPTVLRLSADGEEIRVYGRTGEEAQKTALKEEDVERQLSKTGDTPFLLTEKKIRMDSPVFLPMSAIKDLRREAFEILKTRLENRGMRIGTEDRISMPGKDIQYNQDRTKKDDRPKGRLSGTMKTAVVYKREILDYILKRPFFDQVCLPMDDLSDREIRSMAMACDRAGMPVSLSLPRVFRNSRDRDPALFTSGSWKRFFVHNINEAEYMNRLLPEGRLTAGMSLYRWNRPAVRELKRLYPQMTGGVMPCELSAGETGELAGSSWTQGCEPELLIWGRIPLMVTAQCLKKTAGCCDKRPEILRLVREDGRILPVSCYCRDCYNVIRQDQPRDLIGEITGKSRLIHRHLFDLFALSPQEVGLLLGRYERWQESAFAPMEEWIPDIKWLRGTE